jgi:Holliday junction resolvase RusA-like endonuclease
MSKSQQKRLKSQRASRTSSLPLTLVIPVKPVPASRPRVPRYGKPYFLKTYKKWRDDAAGELPDHKGKPIEKPVYVNVLFAIPRAKSSKLIVPAGDGDNFEKGLYDLLTRKGYLLDDKWITTANWRKRFLPAGSEGYCEITIMEEKDDIDITD